MNKKADQDPAAGTPTAPYKVIGSRPMAQDAVDKARGRADCATNVKLPGMLHGRILRSPHAHARILSIDTSRAEALPGVLAARVDGRLAARGAPAPIWGAEHQIPVFSKDEEPNHG